jgi:hypothetical protein
MPLVVPLAVTCRGNDMDEASVCTLSSMRLLPVVAGVDSPTVRADWLLAPFCAKLNTRGLFPFAQVFVNTAALIWSNDGVAAPKACVVVL